MGKINTAIDKLSPGKLSVENYNKLGVFEKAELAKLLRVVSIGADGKELLNLEK